MDLLFGFIVLGMLLYSGVYILYFLVKIFMPSNTQKKKYTSQSVNSQRQQQRNTRKTVSSGQQQNVDKQETKGTWRSLTAEIKDLMNEMDEEPSKKSKPQTRTASSPVKRNTQAQKRTERSYEGRGSSEGTYGTEGRGSIEGIGGREGRGSREGTASYEGTEFHPQGRSMKRKAAPSSVSSKKKSVGKTTTTPNLKKNIVNAVIYKEILDKPRSRRPIR